MSKKSYFKLAFVIAVLSSLAAVNVYAAESKEISGSMMLGGGTFSPSSKVTIKVSVGPASCDPSLQGSTCQQYAACSKHSSGDRIICTNNTDPKVYYSTVPTTATFGVPAATQDFSASWTSL